MKTLVGRTGSGSLNGTEAPKSILGVGNKVGDEVQGIRDAVQPLKGSVKDGEEMVQGDVLQGVDDRVKGISNMVIIGEQAMFNFISRLAMFISLGVEKQDDRW